MLTNGGFDFRNTTVLFVPFGSISVPLWFHFGSFWFHVGSILVPFGSILVPFWFLLVPFGSILVPFGSIWFHWVPLDSFGFLLLIFRVGTCHFSKNVFLQKVPAHG